MTDIIRSVEGLGLLGLGNSNELVMKGTKVVLNHGGTERTMEVSSDGQLRVNGDVLAGTGSAFGGSTNSLGLTTLGVCGDSISENCFYEVGVSHAYYSRGWIGMGLAMAGVYAVPTDYATSGASIESWTTEWLATVIAARPDVVTLMLGANNAANPSGYPFAASMTALDAVCDALRDAGIYVIHMAIPPQGSIASPVSATISNYIINLNKHVREYWKGKTGGEFVDTYSPLVSSTSVSSGTVTSNPWKADYAHPDTLYIHPSQLAAYYISLVVYPVFARLFPTYTLVQSNSDYIGTDTTSNQLIPNGLMLGTGGAKDNGTATGDVATTWRAVGSANVQITCTKAAADSGIGEKQILTCVASGAGVGTFYHAGIESNFTSGGTIRAAARIKITSATALVRCTWGIFATGASELIFWNEGTQVEAFPTNPQEYLVAMTPGRVLTYTSGSIRPVLYINFSGAGGAVIEISQAEMRKNY